MLPNGLIANLYGPVAGKRHDSCMLAESGLLNQLENLNDEAGNPFSLHGDPAYPIRAHLLCPFRKARITPQERVR